MTPCLVIFDKHIGIYYENKLIAHSQMFSQSFSINSYSFNFSKWQAHRHPVNEALKALMF